MEREFVNKGSYFILIEESSWECKYNNNTKKLDKGDPTGWKKTHIILTKASGEIGMQILRFYGIPDKDNWELASNPYAGVNLLPDEWKQIIATIN